MKAIINFFAREHLFGNLLTLIIVGAGILAVTSIRRDIWPDVNFDVTSIVTVLPGASPEQMENLVLNPLEEAIREVDGLKRVNSTTTEGTAVTVIELDPDARDADQTNTDIQRAVDQVEDFPEEVEKPIVRIIEAAQTPVIEVNISGNADGLKKRAAAKFIADKLSLMSGVAGVDKKGYYKREYSVTPDPEALAERRVPLSQLVRAIATRNISIPGGQATDADGIETLVRTEAQYSEPDDILKTVLTSNAAGFGSVIGDVATVKAGVAEPKYMYRADGERAISLTIRKKKNADALDTVREVTTYAKELAASLGQGIKVSFSNDFTVYLKNRLGALGSNLLIGLGLVIIILTFFLPWQVTLVVAAGIPLALMGAIYLAYIFGFSLNVISLIGLIIVLGMLVDDAIVVSENVWRHIETGKPIQQAVVEGTSEVVAPVMASILTTVSAFAPMLFMSGIFGAFIFEIPVMVILALFLSLFEAFFIMPSHFISWVGPFIKLEKSRAKKEGGFIEKFTAKYKRYVAWSLKRRYIMLASILSFILATGGLLVVSGRFVLFPPEGVEVFFVTLEAETGTSLERMEELLLPAEKIIAKIPETELKDYFTSIGIVQQDVNDPFTKRGSHYANIRVSLTPQNKRSRTAQDIIDDLKQKMPELPRIKSIRYDFVRQGPPQGAPVSIDILGDDFNTLRQAANDLEKELGKIDGIKDIRNSFVEGKVEWQVLPRHSETAQAGLTATEISTTVRAAFDGVVASSVRKMDEEIDIRVRMNNPGRSVEEQLQALQIGNPGGYLVPLKSIADFKAVPTLSTVRHLEYQRVINVSADLDLEKLTAFQAVDSARPIVEEIEQRYKGVTLQFGGEDKDTKESMESLGRAFLFAAFFIFSLLIVTFRNLVQPTLILLSIPLGFTGVVYSMLIHNRPFSFMAMLGVVALAGVIVNNAIVFIDFVNASRKDGLDLDQSIIEASSIRLRPILLTTVTTISGLLPTAYGDVLYKIFGIGGGDPFIIPIALALGWGLAFGTVMIGIFFPAMIRIVDDVRSLSWRKMSGAKA